MSVQQHTVVIFDWDDTLLSSSHLAAMGHRLDTHHEFSEDLKQQLGQLEEHVNSLLRQAFGLVGPENIVIITNAEEGWIQLSAKKFIPGVIGNVRQCKIMSARSRYERSHPGNPFAWKAFAMHSKLQECFGILLPLTPRAKTSQSAQDLEGHEATWNSSTDEIRGGSADASMRRGPQFEEQDKENSSAFSNHGVSSMESSVSVSSSSSSSSPRKSITIRHIISVGDSVVEQHAACCVGKMIEQSVVKCVKLMERPTLKQLLKQLDAVSSKFKDVLDYPEPVILSTMHARDVPQAVAQGQFPQASRRAYLPARASQR